jgi:uncharacterized protein (TIGR02996 family)
VPTKGPDGAELLAAVLASPDDDAPRLVYADWLHERDDPRGESSACSAVGDHGIRALASSPALGNLERLELFGNGIGSEDAIALARSPHLGRLREVFGLIGYYGGLIEPASPAGKLLAERFGDGLR